MSMVKIRVYDAEYNELPEPMNGVILWISDPQREGVQVAHAFVAGVKEIVVAKDINDKEWSHFLA